MAKDPAFLFYPNDYIGGTLGMTFEEKGAYIELLMVQFNRGHMTTHMIAQTVGQIWESIKSKFVQDENGLWYNQRLELEKQRRMDFTESRRNNKEGKNQYTKGHKKGHMTSHMENENKNIDNNLNKIVINKNGKLFKNSDFQDLPEHFYKSIIEQMFILKQKRIDQDTIYKLWDAFKLEKLTGVTWYNSEDEVYKHFSNWIKSQKFTEQKTELTNTQKREQIMKDYVNRFNDYTNEP